MIRGYRADVDPKALDPSRIRWSGGRSRASPRHRKLVPWIALCVIYVVWGSTYMAIRIVVREVTA